MKIRQWMTVGTLILALASVWASSALAEIKKITKEELKPLVGSAEVVIVDTRLGKDWEASEKKIKGAVREDPRAVETWASKYNKNKQVVLYCA